MGVELGHYIQFKYRSSGDPVPGQAYQNMFLGETRVYEGVSYTSAPYLVGGHNASRGGDRGRGTLVGSGDDLSIAIAAEAILNKYLVNIKTVILGRNAQNEFFEASTLISELWACSGGGSDVSKATIQLFSPLDAVQNQFPKRVLNQYLVGSVPSTGSIFSG